MTDIPIAHPLLVRRDAAATAVRRPRSTPSSLVGVAAIALLVVAWATQTDAVGRLLDAVLDSIIRKVE